MIKIDNKTRIIIILAVLLVGVIAIASYEIGLKQNNNELNNNTTANSTIVNNTSDNSEGSGDITYHYETVGHDTFLVDSNGIIHGGQADGCTISYMRQQYQEYLNDPEHYMS